MRRFDNWFFSNYKSECFEFITNDSPIIWIISKVAYIFQHDIIAFRMILQYINNSEEKLTPIICCSSLCFYDLKTIAFSCLRERLAWEAAAQNIKFRQRFVFCRLFDIILYY